MISDKTAEMLKEAEDAVFTFHREHYQKTVTDENIWEVTRRAVNGALGATTGIKDVRGISKMKKKSQIALCFAIAYVPEELCLKLADEILGT